MQHGLEEWQGSLWQPYHRSLITALEVITSGGRPRCSITSKSCQALCNSEAEHSSVADHAGHQSLAQHARADVEDLTYLLALAACTGRHIVADHAGQPSLAQQARTSIESLAHHFPLSQALVKAL